jgi:hypothetical protein
MKLLATNTFKKRGKAPSLTNSEEEKVMGILITKSRSVDERKND